MYLHDRRKNIAQKGVFTLDVLFMSTGTIEIFSQKFAVFEEVVYIFFFLVLFFICTLHLVVAGGSGMIYMYVDVFVDV